MTDTVTVRRGGSYLTIPAGAIDRYIAKGYDVVDKNDNIIQSGVPNDINVLKIAYNQHKSEIESLKAENAKLKQEISELKNQAQKVIKSVEKVVEVENASTAPTKSRRGRKSE